MCVNDVEIVRKSGYRKIYGFFCKLNGSDKHYLEKLAVDCRGVRAELLCRNWAMGLCIVYTHVTLIISV